MHVHPRLAAPSHDPPDQCRRMPHVLRPIGACDDDRGRVVGLHAAIQQMQRLADDPAAENIVHRVPLFVEGLRIVRRMLRVDNLHHRHLLGLRAVFIHVAHERRAEHLPGALPPIRTIVEHIPANRRRRSRAGASDPNLRKPVHCPEQRHGVAQPGFHHADRNADQRLGRGATADALHVEIQPGTNIAGHERSRGTVVV